MSHSFLQPHSLRAGPVVLMSFVIALALLLHLTNAAAAQTSSNASRKVEEAKSHQRHSPKVREKQKGRTVKKVMLVHGKRKIVYQRVAYHPAPIIPTVGDLAGLQFTPDPLMLNSNVAFVLDATSGEVLYEKNSAVALPIASITKLMSGLIVVESGQDMSELLEIDEADVDRARNSRSRLGVGTRLSRTDMLRIALMSSENRAASSLGRNYPGGLPAFVAAMNAKAQAIGMRDTYYMDPTGLSSGNVASARDLAKLVAAAYQHPSLAEYSTHSRYSVDTGQRVVEYVNSNRLLGDADWEIVLQKTGYINEAGRCLVMQVKLQDHAIVMVLLDSKRRQSRFTDADRLRRWVLEKLNGAPTLSALPDTAPR